MEKHLTSLELSKRLKELGFPQESHFYWYHAGMMGWQVENHNWMHGKENKGYSAYLSTEMGEWLPTLITKENNNYILRWGKGIYPEAKDIYRLCYVSAKNIEYKSFEIEFDTTVKAIIRRVESQTIPYWREDKYWEISDKNEANARAKMLIYLAENKLIDVKKLKGK